VHIYLCSWALGMCKSMWIQIYWAGDGRFKFCWGFQHLAFVRHKIKFVMCHVKLLAHLNCIFEGASFKLIINLADSTPEKLQGYGTLPYHCYTLLSTNVLIGRNLSVSLAAPGCFPFVRLVPRLQPDNRYPQDAGQ